MKTRIVVIILFLFTAIGAKAQLYQSTFYVGWNTLMPLSDKEFTSRTSSAGARIGFSKFINDRFGFGIEGAYNSMEDYVPRRTYEYPGGAITTDVHNYLYYFTLMANAQYYFMQGNKFIPYASLGMGLTFSEYRLFYNVYENNDTKVGFVVRPEAGTLFRAKEYAGWGLKAAVSYDFATNKSDYMGVGNFSGVSFLVGVVLFAD